MLYKTISSIYHRLIIYKTPSVKTVVLITGGAQGIGRELALIYAAKGCRIVIWDKESDLFSRISTEINQLGADIFCYRCDISIKQEVDITAEKTLKDLGRVDILVNNAAIAPHFHVDKASENVIRKVNDINFLGQVWVTKAFLPHVRHIATIASVLSYMPGEKESDYCASKFAVNGWFSTLRLELKIKKSPIRMTTIYPYHIKTTLFDGIDFGNLNYIISSQEPRDVAKAIYEGICEKREEVYVPGIAKYACLIYLAFPSELRDWLNKILFTGPLKNLKERLD